MALSHKQLSVTESIKGKVQGLLLLKKKDAKAEYLINKTINEINGLIDTHELSGEKDLLDAVINALIRLKRFGLATSFTRRYKHQGRESGPHP